LIDWGAHKTDLENIRDSMLLLIQAIVFFFIIIILTSLMFWLSRNEGLKIQPFDTGSSKYDGKAISGSIVVELQRIHQIANTINFDKNKIKATIYPHYNSINSNVKNLDAISAIQTRMDYPRLASSRGNIDSNLSSMPPISMAGTILYIGEVLEVIRNLWPIGSSNNIISGSIQNYDSSVRLIAHMENKGEFLTWEVSCDLTRESQISILIQNLAFKIAKDLWPNIVAAKSAKTWEGFKYYIDSLDNYGHYIGTMDINYLDCARNDCIKASEVEKNFGILFDLFYYIGVAYSDERQYPKAEEMFRRSLSIKSTNIGDPN